MTCNGRRVIKVILYITTKDWRFWSFLSFVSNGRVFGLVVVNQSTYLILSHICPVCPSVTFWMLTRWHFNHCLLFYHPLSKFRWFCVILVYQSVCHGSQVFCGDINACMNATVVKRHLHPVVWVSKIHDPLLSS